jgi:hypothetical protein
VWLERTAKSCGPDVAVLALSPREAKLLGGDGGKRAVRRGEHEVSRKATAQGRPGCSACTCMLVCASSVRNCTRDRGCSVHPVFPAPSILREGQRTMQNSGERCREKERPYQFVIAIGRTVPDLPHASETRLPAGHTHRLPRTTFCCKTIQCIPLQKRGKVVEQSGVPKMSLFKMQMTGELSDYFFVTRSDRNGDDLISTYQAGKKSNGKNQHRSVANEIKTRQEKAKRG